MHEGGKNALQSISNLFAFEISAAAAVAAGVALGVIYVNLCAVIASLLAPNSDSNSNPDDDGDE